MLRSHDIRHASPARDIAALLALNNAHAVETSSLTSERLEHLLNSAFMATAIGRDAALVIAFDQAAAYDSPNFVWFQQRLDRFVYVDRIIVNSAHRGEGLAKRLYGGLFGAAAAAGHNRVVCEVNIDPPNPASDGFHAALGFIEIGRGTLGNRKSVRYLSRRMT